MEMDWGVNLRIYQSEDLGELSKLIEFSKEQYGEVKFGPFPK